MAQISTSALQSPATPTRQLGVARGTRRTPASRTKKPYTRPMQAGGHELQSDYQTQGSPGFLKGMRSLVSRLWGTSLKPSRRAAMPATPSGEAEVGFARNAGEKVPATIGNENAHGIRQPGSFSAATVSGATAGSAAAAVACGASNGSSDHSMPVTIGRAATATGRARAQRPTAESLFAPSPFAYNKRLAAATPSVANLRDVERVRADEGEHLKTRASTSQINAGPGRGLSCTQLSTPSNGYSKKHLDATLSRYVSPSNARRLLSTLGSLNTPILDARSRSAGAPATVSSSTARRSVEPSVAVGDRATPMPLRRLPVSLLGLNDAANRTSRSALADSAEVLDASTLRRGVSSRRVLNEHGAAPSLARTIQLQQARKAVADRLVRSRTANSRATGSDAETYASTYAFHDGEQPSASIIGRVHQRDDENDEIEEQLPKKRRRGTSNGEVGFVGDEADYSAPEHVSRQRAERPKRLHGRRALHARRAASAADEGITWRFSARLNPLSDNESSSSSDDEDREALSAKVPADRIRGGELIGLSLRPTMSASSAGGLVGGATVSVRSTGFGSSRKPIPIFSEPEQPSKSAVSASESSSVPDQSAGLTTKSAPTIETPASSTSVPSLDTAVPATTDSEDGLHKQKTIFSNASTLKRGAEEREVPTKPATSSAPSFSLSGFSASKRRADEDEEPVKDQASKPAPPTAAPFSFGGDSAKPDSKKGDDDIAEISSKPATLGAPSFSFGGFSAPNKAANSSNSAAKSTTPVSSTLAAPSFGLGGFSAPKSGGEAVADSAKDAASKSAAPAAPTFSFGGFGKPDADKNGTAASDATSKPEASSAPVFNFGGVSTSNLGGDNKAPDESTSQKPATSTAPAFGFAGFGSSKSDTNKAAETTASSAVQGFNFGSFGPSKPIATEGTAKDTATQPVTTGISLGVTKPESATKDSADISKPSFKFATTGSSFSNAPSQAGAAPAPAFKFNLGSSGAGASIAAERRDSTSVGTKPAFSFGSGSNSTNAFSSTQTSTLGVGAKASDANPSRSFSFTKPATSVGGGSGSFSFASGSTFAAPTKTLDLTKTASKPSNTPPKPAAAPGAFVFGASNAPQASDSMDSSPSFTPAPAPSQISTKPPPFSFSSINTPSAASFNSATVPTPAVPSFGSAVSAAAPSFGAPAATPSSFNFGVASSPAATPNTGNFNFGAKPAAPQPATGFGAASTQSVGGFGGSSAQPTTGFGGSSAQPTTGFGGSSAQPTTGFGGSSAQPTTGFG
ncbi:hypothetical protein H4R24_001640, partial [Coemansia sp. RSA 988]